MNQYTSIADRLRQAEKAERALPKPKALTEVACACGCGVWPEKDMYYYVRCGKDGTYVKNQLCADKYFGISRCTLNRWKMILSPSFTDISQAISLIS